MSRKCFLRAYAGCLPAEINHKRVSHPPHLSPAHIAALAVAISEDGAKFCFPAKDAAMLPIKHSTVEELASYFCSKIIESYTMPRLVARGITVIHVTVSEAPGQDATYSRTFKHNRGAAGIPVSPRDWRSIASKRPSATGSADGQLELGNEEQDPENDTGNKRPKR